jgi:hypothetical protein
MFRRIVENGFEGVVDVEAICFETVDRGDDGVRGGALEPRSGAPGILVSAGDEAVFDCVLVDII